MASGEEGNSEIWESSQPQASKPMKHIVSCVVSNIEISWIEILYIIKTDQEGDSQYDVLQEIKEDARLEKTD